MMTPQEIENRKFDKSMRGYSVDEVDDFLKILAQDYEEIYKENQTLRNKISVLVNKIEEYRRVEESLRNALLSAQQVGETVIRQANVEADIIVREAKVKADIYLADVKTQTEKERITLENLRRDIANFRNKMVSLFKSQIDVISGIDELAGVANPIARSTMESYRPSEIPTVFPVADIAISGKAIDQQSAFTETAEVSFEEKNNVEPDAITGEDEEKKRLKSLFFGFDSNHDK